MSASPAQSRPPRSRATALAVALLLLAGLGTARAGDSAAETSAPASLRGLSLADALRRLGERGLRIVFTSAVVRDDQRVEQEPLASAPREILAEILAPHRLAVREGPGGTLVVVPAPPPSMDADASGAPSDPAAAARVFRDEVVVTPSRVSLLQQEEPGVVSLSRDELLALPHLGDDLFRALSLLPGTASNDASAAFHVRGGRRDETQIRLDGQELFQVFHLEDYDGALSVVSADTLGGAELMTGAFPASFGDRMGGVLDLRTLPPAGPARFRLGLGVLGAKAGGRGALPAGRGGWTVELRRGSTDLLGRLLGREDPSYWDGFGKLELRLGDASTLSANLLHAQDELEFRERIDADVKSFETNYPITHAWLDHTGVARRDLVVETAVSLARIDRDRRGAESEEDVDYLVADRREGRVHELRQAWSWARSPRHELEVGASWRRFESEFDYFARRAFEDPLATLRPDGGSGTTEFRGRRLGRHPSVYVSDAFRARADLGFELGLRWDRYSQTDEAHLSPRASLSWRPDGRSVVRAAWGRFDQSQRPYELQVEDGETRLQRVERSEHRILGYERTLGPPRREVALRVELYQRRIADPRRRYENLFEPLNTFPEVEPARILVAPERSRARGAELYVRGAPGRRLRWWASYVWSRTEDQLDGRWTPRLFDQTHAVSLDLDFDLTEAWRVSAAWRWHTGWPTTPLALEPAPDGEGGTELVPVLGALNSLRLSPYHRLDLRASRSWRRERSVLGFYLEVRNAYGRENAAGYDVSVDEERGEIRSLEENWAGALASAGVTLEF